MREYLRVKIASLAAEARIIRREERRAARTARHARSQEHRDRVEALVKKYGEADPRDAAQRLLAWRAEAGR